MLIVALAGSASAVSAQTLTAELHDAAQRLKAGLDRVQVKTITLQVVGSTNRPSSGPAYIRDKLATELPKLGISVKRAGADAGVECRLSFQEARESGHSYVTAALSFTIVDRNEQLLDRVKVEAVQFIYPEDTAKLMDAPIIREASMPNAAVGDPLEAAVLKAFQNPDQGVDRGTVARAEPGTPFGFEILVNGKAKPLTVEGGYAFAELSRGEEFSIRLINDSPHEVAAQVELDGINSSHFSGSEYLWLIPARQAKELKGWFYGQGRFRAFEITPVEDSVAARLGNTGAIGVIAVSFRRTYLPGQKKDPYDEANVTASGSGVGEGRELKIDVVEEKREFGNLLARIPVRYERPPLP